MSSKYSWLRDFKQKYSKIFGKIKCLPNCSIIIVILNKTGQNKSRNFKEGLDIMHDEKIYSQPSDRL